MAKNRLTGIFSKNDLSYEGRLEFESEQDAMMFLEQLTNLPTDNFQKIKGVKQISSTVVDGEAKYPYQLFNYDGNEGIEGLYVKGVPRDISKNYKTPYGLFKVGLELSQTKETIQIRNKDKQSVVEHSVSINEKNKIISFSYRIEYKYAKRPIDVVTSIAAYKSFLEEEFLHQDKGMRNDEINKLVENLRLCEKYWLVISKIESAFGVAFEPYKAIISEEEEKNLYSLYFLVVKGKLIKTYLDNLSTTVNEKEMEEARTNIGKRMGLKFASEVEHEMFGEKLKYVRVDYYFNISIDEFIETDNGNYIIKYLSGSGEKLNQISEASIQGNNYFSECDFNVVFEKTLTNECRTYAEHLESLDNYLTK